VAGVREAEYGDAVAVDVLVAAGGTAVMGAVAGEDTKVFCHGSSRICTDKQKANKGRTLTECGLSCVQRN
jgi:hypothetical protein